jgi:hypothetical protein
MIEQILSFCRECRKDRLSSPRKVGNYEVRWCPKFEIVMIKLPEGTWRIETGWSRSDLRLAAMKFSKSSPRA